MANKEREQSWKERLAEWKASGKAQRAYAMEHGFPVCQFGYWVRRLSKPRTTAALLPVHVVPPMAPAPTPTAFKLRSERGWTLTLPNNVPASWLAELMRAL